MIELIEEQEKCFMERPDANTCGIDETICGPDCPFRKTATEQAQIEMRLVARLNRINSPITYISRLTGETLYKPIEVPRRHMY